MRYPRSVPDTILLVLVLILALGVATRDILLPFLLAGVVLVSRRGGLKWGLVATTLIVAFGLASTYGRLTSADVRGLINFASVGLLISASTAAKNGHRARDRSPVTTGRDDADTDFRLFEATPKPLWVHDAETLRILMVNEAAIRVYGYTGDEFLTMTVADILAPNDVPRLGDKVAGHAGATSLDGEWRHRRKDGLIIDVEVSSSSVVLDGKPACIVLAVDVPENRHTERVLRRSEALTRCLVDSNFSGVAVIDSRGVIIEANDAFLGIVGYGRDDLDGGAIRWRDLVGLPHRSPDVSAPLGTRVEKHVVRFEAECVRRDGTLAPVLLGVVHPGDGADWVVCQALGLTGLRRAEENRERLLAAERAARAAAQASEKRYRLLARAIPQIVWTATSDGGIDYFNPRWTPYTGLDKSQSQGWGWLSSLHPVDLQRFQGHWDRARTAEEGFSIDVRLRRSDGVYRWHLLHVLCSHDRSGRVNRWLGSFTDIDDQKWAEGALAFLAEAGALLASSLDYQKTLSSLARLVVPHIADLCQIDIVGEVGGGICRMAVSQDDASGAGGVRVTTSAWLDADDAHPAARVLRTGHPETASRNLPLSAQGKPRDSGPWRAFDASDVTSYICVPLVSLGRTFGAITLAMAASGRRYGPSDLVLTEQLARRAATAVDHARLYHAAEQARLEAENASRAKDRFLAVLSHELRTPLSPVLMATSALLDDRSTPSELLPMLEMTLRNVEQEARLIEDLLDVSRIASGKLHIIREPADAHALVWQALENCREDIRKAGLSVEVDLAAAEHHVVADPVRLQQVIWNLLKNAAKFTPSGGRLMVRTCNHACEPGTEGRPLLSVEVEDTGIGISPDFLSKVFDAFEQGSDSNSRPQGGLGLGLAISRAVVEALGGMLRAESPGLGLGSTFTLTLSTILAAAEEADPPPDDGEADRGPLRILLVEDHKDTLRNLTLALELHGHTVVAAETLASALEAASWKNYDLLISDIQLPDGSGLDLMRRIGQAGALAGIALSGYGSEGDIRDSLEAGFSEHLTKPVTFQALEAAVRRVVTASGAGMADGSTPAARSKGRTNGARRRAPQCSGIASPGAAVGRTTRSRNDNPM
jgi:PAS domain S-box-containing protein